jgi:hypothetical protein
MTDSPHETVTDLDKLSGLMFYMASQQFRGKPYTNSDYNHCAPNDYQAECIPLMTSFAAAQDWDALWFFIYMLDERDRIDWFDLDSNPSKWGFMRSAAAMFRNRAVVPFRKTRHMSYCSKKTPRLDVVKGQLKRNYDTFKVLQDRSGVTWREFLDTRLVTNVEGDDIMPAMRVGEKEDTKITWDVAANGHGRYMMTSRGGIIWIGHRDRLDGSSHLKLTSPRWATVTMVALDDQPLDASKKVLVTAIFRCENKGMVHNKARDSVGKQWGSAPVLIETVDATISGLPFMKGPWRCDALSPDGTAVAQVPLTLDKNTGTLTLNMSKKYKTMWYLLRKK